jgi:hypothetical protein
MDTADVPLDPAHCGRKSLEPIELDPHSLPHGRPLDELNLATLGRSVEHSNAKGVETRPPDPNLRCERDTISLTRVRGVVLARFHGPEKREAATMDPKERA